MSMKTTSRRELLKSTAITAAATFAAPAVVRGQNLNNKLRVAIVGMGGPLANAHAESLVELEKESPASVELAGVCDCDEAKRKSAQKVWSERSGHAIKTYDDMRRVLDDPSIDAVTFSTPNHWHSLNVIWGCQAGKDVYVEKPGSHNIFEGRKMVQAARKYNRIVQHGTQCRSSLNIMEGIEKLHQGVIGDVYFARGIAYKIRGNLGKHAPASGSTGAGLERLVWARAGARIQQFSASTLALDLGLRQWRDRQSRCASNGHLAVGIEAGHAPRASFSGRHQLHARKGASKQRRNTWCLVGVDEMGQRADDRIRGA